MHHSFPSSHSGPACVCPSLPRSHSCEWSTSFQTFLVYEVISINTQTTDWRSLIPSQGSHKSLGAGVKTQRQCLVEAKCISSSHLRAMAAFAFLASVQVHNFSYNKEPYVLNLPFHKKFFCVNKAWYEFHTNWKEKKCWGIVYKTTKGKKFRETSS